MGLMLLTAARNMDEAVQDVERQLNFVQQHLSELPDKLLTFGMRVVLSLIVFAIGTRVIALIRRFVKKAMDKSNASQEAVQFLDSALKTFLYIILIFMILQLFGVQAASIATVIGSVGVTVGLAIQGSLSNCIGGILILTLKPFKAGDYIVEHTGGREGTVEQISIFYTRLTTFDGKTVLIPNGTLANSSLTNVTDEPARRIDLPVGISYEADIRKARSVIEKLAAQSPLVEKDRDISVVVDSLGESSVNLIVRFWARKECYWQARFEMLENIKYAFDEEGVKIPYNQLDVHLDTGKRE